MTVANKTVLITQAVAAGWRSGLGKVLEREFSALPQMSAAVTA